MYDHINICEYFRDVLQIRRNIALLCSLLDRILLFIYLSSCFYVLMTIIEAFHLTHISGILGTRTSCRGFRSSLRDDYVLHFLTCKESSRGFVRSSAHTLNYQLLL